MRPFANRRIPEWEKFVGSDRIANVKLTNPYIPGELGYKSGEPDLVLVNERNDGEPCDRISLEVQHEGSDFYNDRLVFYVARHTGNMVASGEIPKLKNLQLVSFQFFDAFPWSMSHNYRHTVQLRNQEHLLFFEKQTITIIEVKKFFDFSEFEGDPIFKDLRDTVKLYNFSSGYLLKEGMKVMDVVYAEYIGEERKAKAIARKLLAMGDSVEKICAATGLYKKQVLKLQNEDTEES